MKLNRRKRRKPIIPINSMSDIAFLLLIFIMVLSLINYKKEIKIDYAEAEYQEFTQRDKNFEIWIDADGCPYFNGEIIEGNKITEIINEELNKNHDLRFHIIADKKAKYTKVNDVIEILKEMQIYTVSLVVKENK